MKKLLFFLLFLPLMVFAQSTVSTGNVVDENNNPLPGVAIQIKGSKKLGAFTDFDGNFSISVPNSSSKILVFSYLGYKNEEVKINDTKSITVRLSPDETQLEEIVVIGYGSVIKKDVTGALATVKVKENIANQSNSIDQLLQGRAAGVQVLQNGANVGSGISVKIRGTNSLRGNNEPLYVIDGVIVSSAGEDVIPAGGIGNSGQDTQNGLNGINPRDIESIQVLKDASATAIYGSRGANGVILITTKKGQKGKVKYNVFVNTTIREIDNTYQVLDGIGFANYVNDSRATLGTPGTADALPRYEINNNNIYGIEYDPNLNPTVSTDPAEIYNWQNQVYNIGYSTKFGASASGGSENGNYYISTGFDDQQGIVRNSSFRSSDIRINLNQNINRNLKFEARLSAFFSDSDFAEGGDLIGSSNQSFVRNAIAFRPVITADVDDIEQDLETSNPYAWINDFKDISEEKRYFGSLGLTYKLPIKGLTYQIKFGGNIRNKDRRRFYGLTTFQGANANGALQISTLNSTSYQINNFLRLNRTFNKKHRVNATFGTTYDIRNVDNSIYAVEDFVTTELTTSQPFLGQVITQPLRLLQSDQQIFSILGRINYTFNNKYVLTASFRRDGVSKFSEENRYGFFPSFALAWRANNEKFIKNLDIFSELKLRAGWGQIGNHGIGPYGTLSDYGINGSLYGTPTNGTSVPLVLNNIANPNLTWETTEQINFGIDFSTKNDIVSGTIDFYDKKTKDLLQSSPIPTSSGFGNILINRGEISNRGVELGLNLSVINNDDFQLNFGGNIAFNKTKLSSLGIPLEDFYINGVAEQRSFYFGSNISRGNIFKAPANVFVEGEETSLFYGYETNGIYQTGDTDLVAGAVPGDVRIVDQNGDGVIDLSDRTFIGNPNPDFVYGFNIDLTYKNLTASLLFNGVYGNDIANGNLLQLDNAEGLNFANILTTAYENAWTPTNPSNTHPRIGYTTNGRPAISDRIIEDGSYLRLNNVTINYSIPVEKSKLFTKLNAFVAGQNLFTITNYSGYNPEITSFLYSGLINGVDWNGPPNARVFVLGLNASF